MESRERFDSPGAGAITAPDNDQLPAVITCIDCGGRAHLVTAVSAEQPLYAGDIATYRCADCRDRWDLVIGEPSDEHGDGGWQEDL